MPDGVLRQPAAPALHVAVHRPDGQPGGVREVGQRGRDELLVGGLERGLLAVPAQRGAQQQQVLTVQGSRPASRTQPHLANENVAALIRRPSIGGTRKPEQPPSSGPVATRDARNASVTTATEAYSRPASSPAATGATSASSRAVGAAGVASTTAAASTSSGCAAEPMVSANRRPSPGPSTTRSSRTVAPVRTANVPPATRASASPAMPPGRPAKTGSVGRAGPSRRAAAPRSSSATQLGHGGARGQLAGVAGVHPAEQGLHEPVDDLVAEPRRDQVTDGDVALDPGGGQVALGAHPSQAGVGQQPGRRELVQVERDPHQRAGQGAERAAGPDPRGRGRRVLDRQPERTGEGHPLGAAVEHRLGADVDGDAGDGRTPQLAAGVRRTLQHEDVGTGRRQVVRGGESRDASPDDDDPTGQLSHGLRLGPGPAAGAHGWARESGGQSPFWADTTPGSSVESDSASTCWASSVSTAPSGRCSSGMAWMPLRKPEA